MIKEKKCKGQNKAFGFDGCGKLTPQTERKYGLCRDCLRIWMVSTNEGDKYIKKLSIEAKKDVKRVNKEKTNAMKRGLETKTELEKKLQTEINAIVRILDKGHPCISSGNPLGKSFDAGHLFSVKSNPHIRFHLFNIFAQSVYANQWKGGQPLEYVVGLAETFGEDVKEYCLSLKGLPSLHLTKDELREKTKLAAKIKRNLQKLDLNYSTDNRIRIRIKIMDQLGIYNTDIIKKTFGI